MSDMALDASERRRAFIAGWRARQMHETGDQKGRLRTPEELADKYAADPVKASPRLLAILGYDAPHPGVMAPDDEIEF